MPTGPEHGEIWEGFVVSHALTISVRDSAALLDATSAPEPGAPYGIPSPKRPFLEEVGRDPGRLRIAFSTKGLIEPVHADCIAAVRDVAALCEALGHSVEEDTPQVDFESIRRVFWVVAPVHFAAALDRIGEMLGKKVTPEDIEPWTWMLAEHGRKISGVEFAATKAAINEATRAMADFLNHDKYDIYVTPTQGAPPPKLRYLKTAGLPFEELQHRIDHVHQFTFPCNVTGLPAMSVPLCWNGDRLPIGVQFVGRYADEARLFRLAAQLETERPWRNKRPPVTSLLGG
jgi:amidase